MKAIGGKSLPNQTCQLPTVAREQLKVMFSLFCLSHNFKSSWGADPKVGSSEEECRYRKQIVYLSMLQVLNSKGIKPRKHRETGWETVWCNKWQSWSCRSNQGKWAQPGKVRHRWTKSSQRASTTKYIIQKTQNYQNKTGSENHN